MRLIVVFAHETETPIIVEADTKEEAMGKAWANEGEPGQETHTEYYIKEVKELD